MKKTLLLVGGVALSVAIAVFALRSGTQEDTVEVTATPSGDEYRLTVISDTVTRKPAGGASQVVSGTSTVAAGDQITTSATGRARLRWPNGTLTTLEEDTQITITELSDGGAKSRIELVVGDIWSRVTKVLGTGDHYEVETQDTVAAVRGTTFRTTYRNRRARVQTLENTVRVLTRRADGSRDESSGVDVTEQSQVDVDARVAVRRLAVRRMTSEELRDRVVERILRERDLRDEDMRLRPTPTESPVRISPMVTPERTLRPSPSPILSATPTPTPAISATPTPSPTPTPSLKVTLDRLVPSVIKQGDTFIIQGANFISGRNISAIASITVGGQSAMGFSIADAQDIFVTPPQLGTGVFDVSVTTKTGTTLTLTSALTIQ